MTKLAKFTPLEQSQINKAISIIPPELFFIAHITKRVIEENEKYRTLIENFRSIEDKKQFFSDNAQIVAEFLNDCGLIGFRGERGAVNSASFIIGAEGISLVLAYLRSKEKYESSHLVQAIKNINLITKSGSKKHASIFLEQQQIHDGLNIQLTKDLQAIGDNEFHKTYLVESFGTTGGNHFCCLTIHKNIGEKDPVVHLFDSSPALLRNGIEAQKNSIANGWCSQIMVNATVKKSFEQSGLVFNNEKYYNNCEPLQKMSTSLCATFAYEMACEIAKTNPADHRAMLQDVYRYPSPHGGKTEMPLNLDEIEKDGYLLRPELGLRAQDVAMSHFVDTAVKPRIAEFHTLPHIKKDGSIETVLERIARYTQDDGHNKLAEQKVFRQKLGHLFEIVTNNEFLKEAQDPQGLMPDLPIIEGTPYIPQDSDSEKPHQKTKELIEAFNKLMPRSNMVNRSTFDEESQECKITFYVGDITGARLLEFMRANKIEAESVPIRFGDNLVGVDPRFSEILKIELTIAQSRFSDLTLTINENGPLFKMKEHPFIPPKATSPINTESLRGSSQHLEK